MKRKEKYIWLSSIEYAANIVTAIHGIKATQAVFFQYSAHGPYDLSSNYYKEIYDRLDSMTEDN